MVGSAVLDVADEFGDAVTFLVLVVCPQTVEAPIAVLVGGDEAEQEEQATVRSPERVALKVEEDVTRVGLGELLEAVAPHGVVAGVGEHERRRGVRFGTGLDLEGGLFAEPFANEDLD
jgi:hypothetical protein